MPECRTCEFEATRVIGDLEECAACYQHRRRTGKPRPQAYIDRTSTHRADRIQLHAEYHLLRTNQHLNA